MLLNRWETSKTRTVVYHAQASCQALNTHYVISPAHSSMWRRFTATTWKWQMQKVKVTDVMKHTQGHKVGDFRARIWMQNMTLGAVPLPSSVQWLYMSILYTVIESVKVSNTVLTEIFQKRIHSFFLQTFILVTLGEVLLWAQEIQPQIRQKKILQCWWLYYFGWMKKRVSLSVYLVCISEMFSWINK